MSRKARFLCAGETTVYHVISRTALDGYPIAGAEKDYMLNLVRYLSRIFFVDVLGFAVMGNHLHLVVRMYPEEYASEEEVAKRFRFRFGSDAILAPGNVDYYRKRWTCLSEFVKDVKQGFSRYYNKKHGRKGYFWGERFKSLIVQDGRTLVNLLAYVDLNPVRAGLVKRPEEYRWSTLGYHVQTGNKGGFLSLEYGLHEWDEHAPGDILRKYREFLYETGALDSGKGGVINPALLKRERKRGYKISRGDRFMFRTRYFTEAGVIGSREFVRDMFDNLKHLLDCKPERRFTPVSGLEGIYSMKRLE